ncbi:MAG: hypothetical protein ACE5F8_08925 [Woeseiaceae bacterium]
MQKIFPLALVLVFAGVTAGHACGDKHLVRCIAGDQAVIRANHPGTVVIYKSANPEVGWLLKNRVPDLLKRAGHTVHVVSTTAELARFIDASDCDLVIAAAADIPNLTAIASIPFVPVFRNDHDRPISGGESSDYALNVPTARSGLLLIVDAAIEELGRTAS